LEFFSRNWRIWVGRLFGKKSQVAYGLWSYPGGHVEPGGTPDEAVAREAQEELGVKLEDARFFKTYPITTPRGPIEIHSFTGQITGDIQLKADELMAYGWFSIESLETMRDKLRSTTVLEQAKDVLRPNSHITAAQ
jgi:8-oxo-dGTP diphosphatase